MNSHVIDTTQPFNSRSVLVNVYKYLHKEICIETQRGKWVNPYFLEWKFNSIEWVFWCQIRSLCRMPLYPQYPVLNYYIDFANPYFKIGVEIDGFDYHSHEKDEKRDMRLKDVGWKIYRIPASDVYNESDMYENACYSDEWYKYKENISVRIIKELNEIMSLNIGERGNP